MSGRQVADAINERQHCLGVQLATSQLAVSPTPGCADKDLSTVKRQCFYLALLIGRVVRFISPILASSLCCDKTFASTLRNVTTSESPGAPCTLARSSTAQNRCSKAARTPSRRIFPSVGRSHMVQAPLWGVATRKITCVPSSWICTRSHPLVAELRVQNVAFIPSIGLLNPAPRPHARGASSLRCLTAARALTSAFGASGSPQ